MGIQQTQVIDIVAVDDETGEVFLTIIDSLEWSDTSTEHLVLLQEKLNTYLSFVEGGQILRDFPAAAGRPIRFDIAFQYPPLGEGILFLAKAKEIVEEAGFSFRYYMGEDPRM